MVSRRSHHRLSGRSERKTLDPAFRKRSKPSVESGNDLYQSQTNGIPGRGVAKLDLDFGSQGRRDFRAARVIREPPLVFRSKALNKSTFKRALMAVGGPRHRNWIIGNEADELTVPSVAKWGAASRKLCYGTHLYRERRYHLDEQSAVSFWASSFLSEDAADDLFVRSNGPKLSQIMQAH